ncbi:MAG: helix-turn-helix domain-containing protein [Bacteroidota bacterium]|nr:helix-turn-helix domain-containing protein [Bacteroidota bacterium]
MKKRSKRQYYKDPELLQKIGAKIREARQKRDVSQESLANDCGIDYSQVNRMELGKVNFSISYLYKMHERVATVRVY